MKTTTTTTLLVSLILLLCAASAQAGLYTVTLKNGNTFDTRYEPIPANYDKELMLLRTDRGNWIGLPKDEIVDIVSEAEASGYGYQVDTTTLYLGFSPNDLVNDSTGEDGAPGEQRYDLDADIAPAQDYSINQFLSFSGVDTSATASAGTPLYAGGGDSD